MVDFKYGEITEKIMDAAFRIHGTLGNGFQETINQKDMAPESGSVSVSYARELEMPVYDTDQHIGTRRADFLADNKKLNPQIIQHPKAPIHLRNHSSDL